MAMKSQDILDLLQSAFPEAHISLKDLAGDGEHFSARIISSAFEGKTRVQQHQMVYQALQGKMGHELHALALETMAPPETVVPAAAAFSSKENR